jgi:hypothetical protein
VGKTEGKTSPHNVRCWAQANRCSSTSTLGEGQGATEEGSLDAIPKAVKITLNDALSLLSRRVEVLLCQGI